VDWLGLILILLDTPTAKQGQFFACPTYSSPDKSDPLMWWFGLWGVAPGYLWQTKEKIFALSILHRLTGDFDGL